MTTTFSGHDIAEKLRAALPDAVEEEREEWVVVSPETIADVCRLLRDDTETDFRMLRSIDAVDFIAVYRCADEESRPVPPAMNDLHRHGHRRVRR